MDIKDFNIKCCEILKNVKSEDGLYNYYTCMLRKKIMLLNDDQQLIKYFLENVDKKSNILELTAGLGQVSHYLNLNGFNNITINEYDTKRLKLACKLNNELNNNCIMKSGKYQNLDFTDYDYVFTINAVGGSVAINILEELSLFEKILNSGKKVILKEGYFGDWRKMGKYNTIFTDKLKEKYKSKVLFTTNMNVTMFFK